MQSKYRVYYEDTDAAGVVYYANYLKFAERARTDALVALGIDQQTLLSEEGLGFVVSRCEVDYHKGARLGEMLTVETKLRSLGKVKLCMEQHITRDSAPIATLQVTIAMINKAGKPQAIPTSIRQALTAIHQPNG